MKKQIISAILALSVLITLIPHTAAVAPPESGSIAISNRQQLDAIRNNPSGSFHLTANIDLLSLPWRPIEAFSGIFDGQGFIIHNFTIIGSHQNAGLFGFASDEAIIQNVGVVGSITVNFTGTGTVNVGGISGEGGNIINCFSNTEISVTASANVNVGGISGFGSTVIGSYNLGIVNGAIDSNQVAVGGIGGRDVNVLNCFNRGDIGAGAWSNVYAGGITGIGGTVSTSYSTGAVDTYMRNWSGGTRNVGAVTGNGAAANSYWNSDSTTLSHGVGHGTSSNVEGLTTGAMKSASSFNNWDFTNIWIIDSTNDGFPTLRSASAFVPNITTISPDMTTAPSCHGCRKAIGACECTPCVKCGNAVAEFFCGLCGTPTPEATTPAGCSCKLKMLANGNISVNDAIEILKHVVGLPNVIDGTA
jgi:hypothetical protein